MPSRAPVRGVVVLRRPGDGETSDRETTRPGRRARLAGGEDFLNDGGDHGDERVATAIPGDERVAIAIHSALAGTRRGPRTAMLFAGPAVVASIAYMDPGNFATNIQAGAAYDYSLLWVVLAANLIAMLFQAMSARLGIASGHNLAELCRIHFPRPVVLAMWAVSEIAAMATDLAEFLGAAIGLSLLFGLPLMTGMVVTGGATYALLIAAGSGFRRMELAIGALVSVIGACYLAEILIVPTDWCRVAYHLVVPALPDPQAVTLAVAIIGATVMPHAIYLHSGLTQARPRPRDDRARRRMITFSDRETVIALSLAGAVNIAMVLMATVFHAGHAGIADIATAYRTLVPLLGTAAATIFLISLLASGISSSVVGTMAGGLIMQGFVGFAIPVWVRRLLTMIPAFVVVAMGVDETRALVLSQVVLSLALPAPMIALVVLSRRRDVMGAHAQSRPMMVVSIACTSAVLVLNAALLAVTFGIPLPGFG